MIILVIAIIYIAARPDKKTVNLQNNSLVKEYKKTVTNKLSDSNKSTYNKSSKNKVIEKKKNNLIIK